MASTEVYYDELHAKARIRGPLDDKSSEAMVEFYRLWEAQETTEAKRLVLAAWMDHIFANLRLVRNRHRSHRGTPSLLFWLDGLKLGMFDPEEAT